MNQPVQCRVLVDPQPNRGSWNMAVDEVLLNAAVQRNQCTFRLYEWCEPTLSLGYFQSVDVAARSSLSTLPMVRRLTGGGAILHHHEWTYSLALPAAHVLAREPYALYQHVHKRLIDVLAAHGFASEMAAPIESEAEQPVLCFARRSADDVVCQGQKVIGSAQRRRRGAILQHGSLLLKRSPHAPEYPGICDLGNVLKPPDTMRTEIIDRLGSLLSDAPDRTGLTREEKAAALELERKRYLTLNWSKNSTAGGIG